MKFARWVFLVAGVYGIIALAPQYFLEQRVGQDYPPAITHPEYFYGFIGVGLAWQILFLLIAADPVRLRMAMLPSILEKASFAVSTLLLFLDHKVPAVVFGFAMGDVVWGVLFALSFYATAKQKTPVR